MKDIKGIVAKNITILRQRNNMTQLDLAEELNYSDKTISKWERAESTPDISVLVEMARVFGVTVDYLVEENHGTEAQPGTQPKTSSYNRKAITYIIESGCWLAAIFAFVIATLVAGKMTFQYLFFIYALPVVFVVRLVFNSIWFNKRHNYYIISLLIWSILATIHITFLYFGINVALVYLLGAAGQAVVILCSFIKRPKK